MRPFLFVTLIMTLASLAGCSSPPKKIAVERMLADPIRVRRPEGRPADPHAGPGGVDYTSEVPPDEAFDCRAPESLFEKMDLDAVSGCLSSFRSPQSISYRLVRKAQPELVLAEPEKAPPCLRKDLPRIPVPREIFFQKRDTKGLSRECYSARVNIEADKLLDHPLPLARYVLNLKLPIEEPLTTHEQTLRLMTALALTPFFEEDGEKGIPATYVPEMFCRKCFQDKKILKDRNPKTPYWP